MRVYFLYSTKPLPKEIPADLAPSYRPNENIIFLASPSGTEEVYKKVEQFVPLDEGSLAYFSSLNEEGSRLWTMDKMFEAWMDKYGEVVHENQSSLAPGSPGEQVPRKPWWRKCIIFLDRPF